MSPRERRFYARAMPPATSGRVSRVSMHLIAFTHVFSAKSEARIPLYAHHAAAAAIFRASTQFFRSPNWRAHTVPYEILFRRRSRARPVSRSNGNKTRARKRARSVAVLSVVIASTSCITADESGKRGNCSFPRNPSAFKVNALQRCG